jgi:hypothetical protein
VVYPKPKKEGLGQLTYGLSTFDQIAPITMELKVLDMEWTESESRDCKRWTDCQRVIDFLLPDTRFNTCKLERQTDRSFGLKFPDSRFYAARHVLAAKIPLTHRSARENARYDGVRPLNLTFSPALQRFEYLRLLTETIQSHPSCCPSE